MFNRHTNSNSSSLAQSFSIAIKRHPLVFASLIFLVFITVILVIAAIFTNRPSLEQQTELTGSQQAYEAAKTYAKAHPIIEKLPIVYAHYDEHYNYTEYRIDGGQFSGCQSDFCLKVTDTTGGNLTAAKQQIKDLGYNPDDFQILYEYTPIIPLK